MSRFAALSLCLAVFASACSHKPMHLTGRVGVVDVLGHKCFYITTPGLKHYEIYSEDPNLREGMNVEIDAVESNRETVCQIGTLLDVLSYKVIDTDVPQINVQQ